MIGTNIGQYEEATISGAPAGSVITLSSGLTKTYSIASGVVQVMKVMQYTNVTVNSTKSITCPAWNGSTGGVLWFYVSGTLTINSGGSINADSKGYTYQSTTGTAGTGGASTAGGAAGVGGVVGTAGTNGGGATYSSGGTGGVNAGKSGGNGGNGGTGNAPGARVLASKTNLTGPAPGYNNSSSPTNLQMGGGPGAGEPGNGGGGGGGGAFAFDGTAGFAGSSGFDGTDGFAATSGAGGGIIRIVADKTGGTGTLALISSNGTGDGGTGGWGGAGSAGGTGGTGGTGSGGGGGAGACGAGGNPGYGGKKGQPGTILLTVTTTAGLGGSVTLTSSGSDGSNGSNSVAGFCMSAGTKGTGTPNGTDGGSCSACAAGNTLPIELLNFNVNCSGKKIDLNWVTATETNNDYFTLERSLDAINFYTLITIKGAGTSAVQNNYYYTDTQLNIESEYYYYRLTQTNFDGTSKQTGLVVAECVLSNLELSILPNPIGDILAIEIKSKTNEDIKMQLYNALGQEVSSSVLHVVSGRNSFRIDVPYLSSGFYGIKLSDYDNTVYGKFFKEVVR